MDSQTNNSKDPERLTYCEGILQAFRYLLSNYPNTFTIGQGLWSPWYVGASMSNLEKEFGHERVIDTPVSEAACTGIAIGASLLGYRPIVIHPRLDFMLLAADQIVNQAAKWSSMFGGEHSPAVTFRAIINRGGEQGAQHSQALHSWFAHIPGLRVVMPATALDARDLLIASVLSNDPVLYIDDRWLYESEDQFVPLREINLRTVEPRIVKSGVDITLVGCSYSTSLAGKASEILEQSGINSEVIDIRVLNPLKPQVIIDSVKKTGRLCVIDGGWRHCGLAGEIIATTLESISPALLKCSPIRVTLPDSPAPTSSALEKNYYTSPENIAVAVLKLFEA